MRVLLTALVLGTLLAFPPGPAGRAGASVIPLGIPELTAQSDLCIRGEVIDAVAEWTNGGNMIHTTYTIQTAETLMGTAAALVKVRVPGGDRDGIHIRNAEAPVYEPGEEVVCFLRPEPGLGTWATFGWFQGKFTILNGMVRELPSTSYDALRGQILQAAANK